jgi:hypothetical protein
MGDPVSPRDAVCALSAAGRVLRPSRAKYSPSKSGFEKALALILCDGPGVLNRTIRGPTYVWALLHDKRVWQDSS